MMKDAVMNHSLSVWPILIRPSAMESITTSANYTGTMTIFLQALVQESLVSLSFASSHSS